MMKGMRRRSTFIIIGLVAGLAFDAVTALAWTGPTASAPGNNVAAPVNVSATPQTKNGDFSTNNFTAFGNLSAAGDAYLVGAQRYLNFHVDPTNVAGTAEANGFGIRENSGGTLEFKSSTSDTWKTLQQIVSGYSGFWAAGTGGIYYSGGSVGIGTNAPGAILNVVAPSDGPWGFSLRNATFSASESAAFRMYQGNAGTVHIYNNAVDAMDIGPTGHVGIGTTAGAKFQVLNSDSTIWAGYFKGANYGIYANSGGSSWAGEFEGGGSYGVYADNTSGYYSELAAGSWGLYTNGNAGAAAFIYISDKRLKDNVQNLDQGLVTLMKLRPVTFTWNDKDPLGRAGKNDVGFIAQEVQAVYPQVVQTDPTTGYEEIDYPRLMPLLVKSIQDQQSEIESLKAQVAALQAKSSQ